MQHKSRHNTERFGVGMGVTLMSSGFSCGVGSCCVHWSLASSVDAGAGAFAELAHALDGSVRSCEPAAEAPKTVEDGGGNSLLRVSVQPPDTGNCEAGCAAPNDVADAESLFTMHTSVRDVLDGCADGAGGGWRALSASTSEGALSRLFPEVASAGVRTAVDTLSPRGIAVVLTGGWNLVVEGGSLQLVPSNCISLT